MGRLDSKVAVITGGSGGIGAAAGRLFVREGARVLLVDLHEELLHQAVQSIGTNAVSCAVADVTQPEQVQAYVLKSDGCKAKDQHKVPSMAVSSNL
jgi:NAD(P)-dependent dehydrogenase (short-subunit alcohol dehydrogenase family)